jgi:isocitrate dehydrogenase kinase/phosphatase
MWGLWDLAVAEEFRGAVLKHARVLRSPWGVLADTREFTAQSVAVTEIRKDVMQRVLQVGCNRVASLGEHAVHSMQFKRIAGESHMNAAVFHDEETALAWVSAHDDASSR